MNAAVSQELIETIAELQKLKSLEQFYLAGGTNLAYRFQHRESNDIDLFCANIIGRKGFEAIEKELRGFYGDKLMHVIYPCDIDEQFVFQRIFLQKKSVIKIELLQNMKRIEEVETVDNMQLATVKDIGLFKLVSGANRKAHKDIYDLDLITDLIPLRQLFFTFTRETKLLQHQ